MKQTLRRYGLLGMMAFASLAVQAQDKDWYGALRLGFQPYTIDLEGTVAGRDFDATADLMDVLDETESMWGFEAEFGKGRWFLNVAAFYQEVVSEKGNMTLGVETTGSEFAVNPMLGYNVYRGDRLSLDVMGGIYYVRLDVEVDIYAPAPLGNLSRDTDLDFLDPMVGVRAYYAITEKFGVSAAGQVGGFGVGSEIHVVLGANLVYNFTDWFAVTGGYRWWHWEYEDDDATLSDLEQTLYGPIIGIQFTY
ncbi:MAG: outer membrane beta-barrel protein [Victivallales bacterium]|nr:outer membrane beta-barrel protein [Victivallales bacterium]